MAQDFILSEKKFNIRWEKGGGGGWRTKEKPRVRTCIKDPRTRTTGSGGGLNVGKGEWEGQGRVMGEEMGTTVLNNKKKTFKNKKKNLEFNYMSNNRYLL